MRTMLAPPMSTPHDAGRRDLEQRYQRVCDLFPDQRVEIVNGRIVIREVPTLDHNRMIFRLLLQIMAFADQRGWTACNDIKLFLGTQVDRYRPDITVVPAEPRMWDAENVYADQTLLVVEVVSPSSRDDDNLLKPHSCSLAGVPLYLVIDPLEKTARLLSQPGRSGYVQQDAVMLGELLLLPDPWDLKLDTGKFLN
ncbi:Uma2 family endonuclease [Sphaerisporangium album]|nr:Uma2 family endonuclease [Sphaerisporangium album]